MANTGVLPFVRGVDFSSNDFGVSVPFLQGIFDSGLQVISDLLCIYRKANFRNLFVL